jgi:hypothetical protein
MRALFQRSSVCRAPKRSVFKYRPLNTASIAGVVHDVQLGYLPSSDDACMQFSLTHNILDQEAAGATNVSGGGSLARQTPNVCVKQQVVVRVCGSMQAVQDLRLGVVDGAVVKVVGQLRINPQIDGGKKQPFPYIMCTLPPAAADPVSAAEPPPAASRPVGSVSIMTAVRARLQVANTGEVKAKPQVSSPPPAK